MRPLRSLLLLGTMSAAVYAWLSLCVLWAQTWLWAQYCWDWVIQEVYEYCWDWAIQSPEECDAAASNWSVCIAPYGGGCTYCNSDCKRAEVVWPKCWDWIVNDNETCDDWNKNDLDSCNNLCKATFCWDNVKQEWESCDNGSSNWAVCNPGSWTCTYCSASCEVKTLVWARCWDGKLDAWETCDDGNSNNNDACNNSCKATFCGDWIVQAWESCDNGWSNWSVCSPAAWASCSYCSATCKEMTVKWAVCWDGNLDAWETCDDGNKVDWDGCASTCIKEPELLLDTWASIEPFIAPEPILPANVVKFGSEPVQLPTFLPSTWGPKTIYRWHELNK